MNHYCVWFVAENDPSTRRAEISLPGTIHNHQVLEDIERKLAANLGLSRILITHWQRFEACESAGDQE